MTRSLLALAAAALLSVAAVACGAAPESGSNKLPTCDPDTEDCAKSNSHKPSTGSNSSTSESDITQTTDPASPSLGANHDAGADAAPAADAGPDAAKTTFCQDLMTCCGELKAQGYDNSLCKGVVAKNDQTQCLQKLASYQSFGDCSQAH